MAVFSEALQKQLDEIHTDINSKLDELVAFAEDGGDIKDAVFEIFDDIRVSIMDHETELDAAEESEDEEDDYD